MPSPNPERLLEELRLPKPRNSAGRNVPVAVAMGAFLGALVIGSLFLGAWAWYVLVAGAAALGTWEVAQRLRESDWMLPRPVLILGGQSMIWLSWPMGVAGIAVGLLATLMFLLVSRLFLYGANEAPRNWLRDVGVGCFIILS